MPMCLAVLLIPSLSSGTSFVSMAYVSALVSVRVFRFMFRRPYSAAMPSLRLQTRSTRLQRLMYRSALLLTPDRTVSKVSCRFWGRLSSKLGGRARLTNSS